MDDETAIDITKMKNLRVFNRNQISHSINEHLIEFARKLPHLSEHHVEADKSITDYGIQEVLRYAEQLSCLKIRLPMFRSNSNLY